MRRVTFSRNYTISLSRTCRCYCKYCAFATRKPHLHSPAAVERMLDEAVRRGAKELLVLTGEAPDEHPEVLRRLRSWGHRDFLDYVVWTCRRALDRGLLPHTNVGVVTREELVRLRRVTASQGLMLESIVPDLVVHQGSPTKHPRARLRVIELAGELKIPFTTGILVGIGERHEDRIAGLAAIASLHRRYGHVQEVILQNFVPHPRYYGQEPAEIADAAQGGRREPGQRAPLPAWASEVTLEEMRDLVRACRQLMPDVGIQIPPNLAEWWIDLVEEGATDLGGLSANGDHISPEHPFPKPQVVRRQLAERGYVLGERLCVYPQYMNEQWLDRAVLDVIRMRYWTFLPRGARLSSGVGRVPSRDLVAPAIAKARDGRELSGEELAALFAETRPEAVEEIRQAADELRAELAGETVTFVVNRNINVTNVCTVGCAFCGFGQSRRSPDAYELDEAEFVRRVEEAVAYGATEICMQSGIHPDWTLDDYLRWLRLAKEVAPQLHLHAYSPMEVHWMCERSGLGPRAVFERLKEAGLGSVPGTAAEILDDAVRERISPNKLPVARWVEIIEAAHASGLRSTATVMFGHVESPWELAEHVRIVRQIQERTGGFTEFVPLSFIPFQTLLGRRYGIEEIGPAENLKHTAVFRLALGRAVRNLQASWVKMGIELATEALRWGVNDLGGTLMEENISRLAGAQHGVRLDPPELVAAAHRAGRPAAERTTLYEIRRRWPIGTTPAPPGSAPPPRFPAALPTLNAASAPA